MTAAVLGRRLPAVGPNAHTAGAVLGVLLAMTLVVASAVPSEAEPGLAGAPDTIAELAKLDTLPIKGRAPKTGYDRELFGPAWCDDVTVADGHNGCHTRNDILRRDLVDIEIKPGTNGCVVLSGTLNDFYTGTTIEFHRGRGTSREVQIDHIVALSDAWQKVAQQWDEATRRNFADDPANLQATDGSANEQKEDGDAATWLPPNKSYRCTYVSRIVDVKAVYGLWVTQAEHDAIARILTAGCAAPEPPEDPPAPADQPVPLIAAPPPPAGEGLPAYFPDCAAARAAGAAPIYAGQPGYRPELDGDGDGVAC
jgi:hypothetical protein